MNKEFLIERTIKHFEAVRTKDLNGILDFYARSEDLLVFVEGPRWRTLGFSMVSKGWTDFMDSAIKVEKAEWVEDLRSHVEGGMGFVAGVSELTVEIAGRVQKIRFRGTFVFRQEEDGEWRAVHEHFSQPAADPYGVGDWLKPANS